MLTILKQKYGDPNVVWASGKLRAGQKVKIVIRDEQHGGDRIVEAIATGKQRKGKNIIRYINQKNRTWMLPMDNQNIQIEWTD